MLDYSVAVYLLLKKIPFHYIDRFRPVASKFLNFYTIIYFSVKYCDQAVEAKKTIGQKLTFFDVI